MKATETPLLKFLDDKNQFIVPIFQRKYSWTEKHCKQLWDDIIRVSDNSSQTSHFIGSIVHISDDMQQPGIIPQLLIIDGQQRLTSIYLLLIAILEISSEYDKTRITDYYLVNEKEKKDRYHKLVLTKRDKETLYHILGECPLPENYSRNVYNNFSFFKESIATSGISSSKILAGLNKLFVVNVALLRNNDDPQQIFESLNSTGLELSQSDLIRNYILMNLSPDLQNHIYDKYWYPLENIFSIDNKTTHFDKFIRHYLTLKTGKIPNIRRVYENFRNYFSPNEDTIKEIISEILYFGKLYSRLAFNSESDPELKQVIDNINTLEVNVAYPFLLRVLADFDKKYFSKEDLLNIFKMIENYVFRRVICDVPTNSLNKIFAALSHGSIGTDYLYDLKNQLTDFVGRSRFPSDIEFKNRFVDRNVYYFRNRHYLFEKLENHNQKEISKWVTLEHIMPQNPNLSQSWIDDLGPDYKEIQEVYLHTIGNLTLTGYNSEYGDKSFLEKRDMPDIGFAYSPIRLNQDLKYLDKWDKDEIIKRSHKLADNAIEIWPYPNITLSNK